MNKLPVEIILQTMSFMSGYNISKLCKSNKTVYKICKANKNLISQYALKNDNGFIRFLTNLNYVKIKRYFNEINRKNIATNNEIILLKSIQDNNFEVVSFLIENGVDNYFEALTSYITVEMFKFIYDTIRRKHTTNNVFEFIDNQRNDNDDIGSFGNILFMAFVFANVDLVDYLVHNFSHLINRDIIEELETLAQDRGIYVISDYSKMMLTALENDDWENLETFANFYTNYPESEDEDENESIS